jgi:hypothetical protein
MRIALSVATILLTIVCTGCESSAPPTAAVSALPQTPPPEPAAPRAPGAAAAQPAAAQAAADGEAPPVDAPPANAPAPAAPDPGAPPAAPPATADGGDLKKAEVGVGAKGRDYGGPGFITTPVMAKFAIEQRIAFEVQIPNAMKLYKAAHENKGPKTHEEFMSVIIKENGVQLPDLPTGETYLYVPEIEELMVKEPKPAEAPKAE